ncbi:MAG: AMP-binding protein [Candidatus Bathyarchaeota archaeon]|nr:AMP-binding protein [Candidatus Bathyarchaeota archaeon]
MPRVVLVTGATGFIGGQVSRRLAMHDDVRLVLLVRSSSIDEAVLRVKRSWHEQPNLARDVGGKIKVIRGDLTQSKLGLAPEDYRWLTLRLTHIIHCAADTTPNMPLPLLRKINVEGTANVIELARAVHRDHGLERLGLVSTAFVAGKRRGSIDEEDLTDAFGFSSLYEQTKYESEKLASKAKAELPLTVFRPSLVVGDSETGEVKTFNTIYYLLRLYLTGQLRIAPASAKMKLNIVPIDYVADAIIKLTFDEAAAGLTLHLTAPNEKSPSAGELVEAVRLWAAQSMGLHLPKTRFVSLSTRTLRAGLKLQQALVPSNRNAAALQTLAPYFSQNQTFSRKNTDRLLGSYSPDWQRYLPRLLQYAVYYSFFHRSERTVHEQILFRLQNKSKPVRYHEIVGEKVVDFSTEQVRQEMLRTAAALRALGVGRGDVVAVVGNNCLRYLMVDVAAGLVGAVLCPLYVTSPVADINRVLLEAEARVLFVGAPNLLAEVNAISSGVPVVSFCPGVPGAPEGVMSWETFLAKAVHTKPPAYSPVDFSDVATIRHTYGSTGEPKGACLSHGSLRYIAEALASNFPWKTRTTQASYLSFLPLNHVAEGITAAYSPYFFPATMDIYYLADYQNLPCALALAKPSVVFSIPRFYEKLWSNVAASSLGRQYLAAEVGIKKRMLGRILRSAALRKAGLNHCSQFIVGAACSSEVLLRSFHELGIEIYNAYGLSEAPLVAMNPLGKNTFDTVGYPLKQTELRIDEDGEVMVKGPQVMTGYFNRGGLQSFRGDWLATGDIGELTAEGRLRILGRKKHVIVTSYGKKVPVERIEASFKALPFVRECLVVGENKPFCSAVFWVDEQKEEHKTEIEEALARINLELEGPAQIKRCVVLVGDIEAAGSAEALKRKRQDLLSVAEEATAFIYQKAQ